MEKGDRYRLVIIISYILLIICAVILLAGLWNISLSPDVHAGNGLFFLVFIILILTTIIFILHLLEERHILITHEQGRKITDTSKKAEGKSEIEAFSAPFEVDLDELAEKIIPRINPKESIKDFAERILLNFSKHFEIVQGIIYLKNSKTQEFESLCTYAYTSDKDPAPFKIGDGLPGQVAKNKTLMNLTTIPQGYLVIQSGLGNSSPNNLLIIPLLLNKETIGIIELATFHPLDKETEWTFKYLAKIIGNSLITKIKSAEKK